MPPLPDKRYLQIGDVSSVCDLKPHVLRYWEKQFEGLAPKRRRGQRRYYTRDDIIMILNIKHLLYDRGFTIDGAREHIRQSKEMPAEISDAANQRIRQAVVDLKRVQNMLRSD